MQAYFSPISVNQAGETALDIAKRLKATQCEDLVSKNGCGDLVDTDFL
jgi:hypothetical protein